MVTPFVRLATKNEKKLPSLNLRVFESRRLVAYRGITRISIGDRLATSRGEASHVRVIRKSIARAPQQLLMDAEYESLGRTGGKPGDVQATASGGRWAGTSNRMRKRGVPLTGVEPVF